MPLTLWRGSQLLGELRMHSPVASLPDRRPRQFHTRSAFLIPAEGVALEGVQQMRVPILDETRVFQDPIEPSVSSKEDALDLRRDNRPVAALEAMTPEEALGIPYAAQLRLVGDAGEEVETRALWLHESRYDPEVFSRIQHGVPGESMDPIPTEAYVRGSVWTVTFVFDPPAT
jgi:hypothetical protein